jgi:hypothetical protein
MTLRISWLVNTMGCNPPAQPKDTFMSMDGIYMCQFHAIVVILYSLIKTYNAVIQLLGTCLGAAKIFI